MIRTLVSAMLVLGGTALAVAQAPMHMSYSDTSVATVLKVIAQQTRTSIVYVGKENNTITLDVNVASAEEAVRAASAAAGLAYRKVGNNTYIVAKPGDEMRQALRPYSTRTRYDMDSALATRIKPMVEQAFPDATVQVTGNSLVFIGIADDIRDARTMIFDLARANTWVNDVVPIYHSTPADMVKVITGLYPDLKVASAGDEKSGAVTISGPAADVELARAFATKVDSVVQAAPELTFQVYDIKYASAPRLQDFLKDAAKDVECFIAPESYSPKRAAFTPLGAAIASAQSSGGAGGAGGAGANSGAGGAGSGGGAGGGGQDLDGGISKQAKKEEDDKVRSKRLVLRGTPEVVASAMRMLTSVDVKPLQVLVEVKVVEASPSLTENSGFNWNWSPINFFEAPPGVAIDGFNTNSRPLNVGQFSRAPVSFGSILNAKITSGEAKMLANPRMQVVDNDSANIFIGDTIRARVVTQGALGAQNVTIEEFPVGIILLIHPRINADGNITMHVDPVISTVTDISSDNIPQTSSREAETTVIVKDGETIVLGGLIQDQYTKTVSEVPFLSKLPIVGELFKNRSKTKKRTDVIVTITPHIISDSGIAPGPFPPDKK